MSAFPAANLLLTGIFLFCLGTLAAGALLAVCSARLIRSVSGLALCCIGLAGLYYFLHSPFLALMEILIYVGAVCVTIMFAIMLAEPEEPASRQTLGGKLAWGGMAVAVALAIFGGLAWLGTQRNWTAPAARVNDGSIQAIGIALLTTYSLAFELISLALLVAILGALAIARTGRTTQPGASAFVQSGGQRPRTSPEKSINGRQPSAEVEPSGVLAGVAVSGRASETESVPANRAFEESRSL